MGRGREFRVSLRTFTGVGIPRASFRVVDPAPVASASMETLPVADDDVDKTELSADSDEDVADFVEDFTSDLSLNIMEDFESTICTGEEGMIVVGDWGVLEESAEDRVSKISVASPVCEDVFEGGIESTLVALAAESVAVDVWRGGGTESVGIEAFEERVMDDGIGASVTGTSKVDEDGEGTS